MTLERALILAIPLLLGVIALIGFLVPGLPRGVELSTLTLIVALITGLSSLTYERRVRRAEGRLKRGPWRASQGAEVRLGGFGISVRRQQSELDFDNIVVRDISLFGAQFAGASFTNARLANVQLGQADLSHSDFSFATLTDVGLAGVELRSALLSQALLERCTLTDADLKGVDLEDATVNRSVFARCNLSSANLIDARVTDSDFSEALLEDADMTRVVLERCDLAGADLANADLTGAQFRSTSPLRSNFFAAELDDTHFDASSTSHVELMAAILNVFAEMDEARFAVFSTDAGYVQVAVFPESRQLYAEAVDFDKWTDDRRMTPAMVEELRELGFEGTVDVEDSQYSQFMSVQDPIAGWTAAQTLAGALHNVYGISPTATLAVTTGVWLGAEPPPPTPPG